LEEALNGKKMLPLFGYLKMDWITIIILGIAIEKRIKQCST